MKDPVKSGAIFRLKNPAALKHARPPPRRGSAFARIGKSSASGSSAGPPARRRVVGLGRPAGTSFARLVGKPAAKDATVLVQKRKEEPVVQVDEASVVLELCSGSEEETPAPAASSYSAADKAGSEGSSSFELPSEADPMSEEDEEEQNEAAPNEQPAHVPPAKAVRRTEQTEQTKAIAVQHRVAGGNKKQASKANPAETKTQKRPLVVLGDTDSESSSEDEQPQVTQRKKPIASGRRKRRRLGLSSDDSEEFDTAPRKRPVPKKPSPEPEPSRNGRSRRQRKPVAQWWAVNPNTVDDWTRGRPKKKRRASAPTNVEREASGSPPAPKSRDPAKKARSTSRKPAKKSTIDKMLSKSHLPKPKIISEDEGSPVLQQSVFAKSSPAKKISASRRRSSRSTPVRMRNLQSPHLTPITPVRASRVAQALFTFGEQEEEATPAAETANGSEERPSVPMQPLRSSHDEFGLPSIPYPDNEALAQANWYTLEQ